MTRRFLLPDGTTVEVSEDDETVTCHCGTEMEVCCDGGPFKRVPNLVHASSWVCPECDDPCRVCKFDGRDRAHERRIEAADLARKGKLEDGG